MLLKLETWSLYGSLKLGCPRICLPVNLISANFVYSIDYRKEPVTFTNR